MIFPQDGTDRLAALAYYAAGHLVGVGSLVVGLLVSSTTAIVVGGVLAVTGALAAWAVLSDLDNGGQDD